MNSSKIYTYSCKKEIIYMSVNNHQTSEMNMSVNNHQTSENVSREKNSL